MTNILPAPQTLTPTTRGTILVVEDEPSLQELLRYHLGRQGYRVECVARGEQAVRFAQRNRPDLILLDLMLPGMDGLEVYRKLRADPETLGVPVVMVSARAQEADVVTGLELGADDYIVKPFSPPVLVARVRAVLRRRQEMAEQWDQPGNAIRIHELTIDRDRYEVRRGDTPLRLTATEFRLLEMLAGRPGRVFTRQQIIAAIHGETVAVTERSVDVQVVGLRRKLGEAGAYIETVHGVGYRFRD